MSVLLSIMCILAEAGGTQGNSGVQVLKGPTEKGQIQCLCMYMSHSQESGRDLVR